MLKQNPLINSPKTLILYQLNYTRLRKSIPERVFFAKSDLYE